MSMSGTEREPESTAPDVSAVTGLRPGESSTSTMPSRPAAPKAKPSLGGITIEKGLEFGSF